MLSFLHLCNELKFLGCRLGRGISQSLGVGWGGGVILTKSKSAIL